MAVAVLQHVLIDNYEGADNIYAGMAVSVDESNGSTVVVSSNRSDNTLQFLGVAYDDTASTGNTMAVVDPVNPGNYSHDSSDGLDPADYSGAGYMAQAKRALADYRDETLGSIVQNWTQGSTRIAKRPIGVITVGGRLKTDQYVSTASTSGAAADAGAAPTFAINSPLTFACVANRGKFIFCTTVGTDGPVVARIVDPSVTSGLLHVRLTGLQENLLS